MQGKTVMANPGRRVLTGEEQGIVVGPSQEAATAAMQIAYTKPPPLADTAAIVEEAKTRLAVCNPGVGSVTVNSKPQHHLILLLV